MKKRSAPSPIAKHSNLLEKIKECIEKGNYIVTTHAFDMQNKRAINLPATLHVLKTGQEEKRKTVFDFNRNAWKYAIRGKTLNNEDVRVIIGFDEDEMLIITVIQLEKL